VSKSPIDAMMDSVPWQETSNVATDDGMPYATHHGILRIFDLELRCYRLNTGQAVIHADDMHALLGLAIGDTEAKGAEG
jgi:hypothetical protein